ncbi:MAG: methyl-accepting chemotaxis protein [Sulfuritalea sp.]|nr:methyl-accepting chemotaxis protein [Sulfuritalea sp.]
MEFIFSPAIALMSRLKYSAKFAILGLLAVLNIGYLLATLIAGQSTAIRLSGNERAALELIGPIHKQIQLTQQHRGLSAGYLGGNAGMKPKLEAKQAEVAIAIKEVDAIESRRAGLLRTSSEWTGVKADWDKLRGGLEAMKVPETLATHGALIERALRLQVQAADAGSLVGDPDIDSFYIIDTLIHRLPAMLERLGKVRAKGTGTLSRKEISEADKVEFQVHLAVLKQSMDVLKLNLDKAGQQNPAIAPTLKRLGTELGAASAEVMTMISDDIVSGRFSIPPQTYFDKCTQTIDIGYRELFSTLVPTLDSLLKVRQDRLQRDLILEIGVSAVFVLLLLWLSGGAYYAVIRAVHDLSHGATAMAGGDLTVRISMSTSDELSEVGESFNRMATSIQALLRSVQQTASSVSEAASEVSRSANRVSDSSSEQSQAATGMASAVQQMTASIDQISEHARTAQQVSVESGSLSEQGGRIVDGTAREMERIADTVNESARIIEQLGKHSEGISAIVNVIKEIADQTNLLALNAAIEAARAGEQGRGFAVVADEVRKLAERTTKSTTEISDMIGAIQQGTKGAVDSMKSGVMRVAEGVTLSRRAGESIAKIQQGTQEVRQSVGDISNAMSEQSLASNEIARGVEHIAQMAERNSVDVRATADTVLRLEQMASALQAEVKRFRV